MAESKLNKALHTDLMKLKLSNKTDAPVRFLLEKSPFDDDDDEDEEKTGATAKSKDYVIVGQIFPKSDIYKEAAYRIEIKLTRTFPIEPPEVRFLTPIYHLNVGKDGKFCHDLLKITSGWKPSNSLVDVVRVVVDGIDNPDVDYAFSFDLGKEYTENRAEFDRKATEYVHKHGLRRN